MKRTALTLHSVPPAPSARHKLSTFHCLFRAQMDSVINPYDTLSERWPCTAAWRSGTETILDRETAASTGRAVLCAVPASTRRDS